MLDFTKTPAAIAEDVYAMLRNVHADQDVYHTKDGIGVAQAIQAGGTVVKVKGVDFWAQHMLSIRHWMALVGDDDDHAIRYGSDALGTSEAFMLLDADPDSRYRPLVIFAGLNISQPRDLVHVFGCDMVLLDCHISDASGDVFVGEAGASLVGRYNRGNHAIINCLIDQVKAKVRPQSKQDVGRHEQPHSVVLHEKTSAFAPVERIIVANCIFRDVDGVVVRLDGWLGDGYKNSIRDVIIQDNFFMDCGALLDARECKNITASGNLFVKTSASCKASKYLRSILEVHRCADVDTYDNVVAVCGAMAAPRICDVVMNDVTVDDTANNIVGANHFFIPDTSVLRIGPNSEDVISGRKAAAIRFRTAKMYASQWVDLVNPEADVIEVRNAIVDRLNDSYGIHMNHIKTTGPKHLKGPFVKGTDPWLTKPLMPTTSLHTRLAAIEARLDEIEKRL